MSTHSVDALFAALASVEPYPAGVVAFPGRIPGTAFFPGGAGLWGAEAGSPLPPMPHDGVMVLGHDFHSEEAFARSFAAGTEVPRVSARGYRTPPTWQNLLRLLAEVDIPPERCFFTNAYMGLRQGAGTMGRFPGARDAGFVDRCRQFLLRQFSTQMPKLVVTLGAWVPSFLAPLAPQLALWEEVRSLPALDRVGPVVHSVAFSGLDAGLCSVVALTHPSLRASNVRRRRYAGLQGHPAEVAMLRESIARSGMT